MPAKPERWQELGYSSFREWRLADQKARDATKVAARARAATSGGSAGGVQAPPNAEWRKYYHAVAPTAPSPGAADPAAAERYSYAGRLMNAKHARQLKRESDACYREERGIRPRAQLAQTAKWYDYTAEEQQRIQSDQAARSGLSSEGLVLFGGSGSVW